MIDSDVILGLHTLLLFGWDFGLGYITDLSARRIIPERRGYQSQEDDEPWNNLLAIIHGLHPCLS